MGWYKCEIHGGYFATIGCPHIHQSVTEKSPKDLHIVSVVEGHFAVVLCRKCHAEYTPNMIDGIDENIEALTLIPMCSKCYGAVYPAR